MRILMMPSWNRFFNISWSGAWQIFELYDQTLRSCISSNFVNIFSKNEYSEITKKRKDICSIRNWKISNRYLSWLMGMNMYLSIHTEFNNLKWFRICLITFNYISRNTNLNKYPIIIGKIWTRNRYANNFQYFFSFFQFPEFPDFRKI